jgi:transposase-like protein
MTKYWLDCPICGVRMKMKSKKWANKVRLWFRCKFCNGTFVVAKKSR